MVYTLDEIREIITPIAVRYRLKAVYVFGSYARGDATASSDVDLCVDAAGLTGFFALGGLYSDLEEALKKKLDLITVNSLRYNDDKHFQENLRKELLLIYDVAQ